MSGDFAVGFAFGKKRNDVRLPGGQTFGTFADRPTSAGRGEDCADLLPEVVETKLTKHRIRFIQQFKGASVVTRRAPRKEHQRSMIVYLAEKGSEPSTATQLGRVAKVHLRGLPFSPQRPNAAQLNVGDEPVEQANPVTGGRVQA